MLQLFPVLQHTNLLGLVQLELVQERELGLEEELLS